MSELFKNFRLLPRSGSFLDRKVGSKGEVFYDSTTGSLRTYDGNTAGGDTLAKTDLSNVSDSDFLSKIQSAGGGGGGGNTTVTVSSVAPSDPSNGNLWFNTSSEVLFVYNSSNQSWKPSSGDYQDIQNTPFIPTNLISLGIQDGDPGQFLTTDGNGNFSFQNVSSTGNFSFSGSNINVVDSSSISIVPLTEFNSDVIVDGDLIVEGQIEVDGNIEIDQNARVGGNMQVIGDVSITGTTQLTRIDSAAQLTLSAANGIVVEDLTTFVRTNETLVSINNATGVVTHDLSLGAIFYHTNLLANFTAAFTNVETTANRVLSVLLVLDQGAAARIPSAVTIGGASQTIRWSGGTPPSGTANYIDLVSFTLIRVSGTWTVIGSLSTFN